jgi:hypothetical protein
MHFEVYLYVQSCHKSTDSLKIKKTVFWVDPHGMTFQKIRRSFFFLNKIIKERCNEKCGALEIIFAIESGTNTRDGSDWSRPINARKILREKIKFLLLENIWLLKMKPGPSRLWEEKVIPIQANVVV